MRVSDPNGEVFHALLNMVKGSKENRFKIGSYTLHFRYAIAKVGDILPSFEQVFALDKDVSEENIKGLVFDVAGMNSKYITETQLSDGFLYVFPDRSENIVDQFVETVKRNGKSNEIKV